MIRPQAEILEIMDIFNQKDPNPRCELNYSNAYTLLVAVVLSAQSTDKALIGQPKNCSKSPTRRKKWQPWAWIN